MPYNNTHPDYDHMRTQWAKCRDCSKGQRAIHAKGPVYLPKLDKQTPTQYESYLGRALFLNAFKRTIDTLQGLVFRKDPTFDVPVEEWIDDLTASGTSLKTAARQTFYEAIGVGRAGWLVDFPTNQDPDPKTVAEVEASGTRPFAKMYAAESIVNWKTDIINGRDQLSLVVLKESVLDAEDEFDTSTYKTQYRVLDINEGKYRVRVYQDVDERSAEAMTEVYPQINGRTLDYIPFVPLNEDGISIDVKEPPMSDLADINLSHYKAYADYRHGLHYVGLPTPVISGVDSDDEGLTIGPSSVLTIPEVAKAYYLEFEGKGLESLKDELESLKNDMAAFGARLLRTEKKAVEAAETAAINRAGETSTVASWAAVVDQGLTRVLEIMAEWAGVSGEIRVELNKDYMPMPMDAQTLTATMNAVINGQLSKQEFFEIMKKGEIIADSKTYEDHEAEIVQDGPNMVGDE